MLAATSFMLVSVRTCVCMFDGNNSCLGWLAARKEGRERRFWCALLDFTLLLFSFLVSWFNSRRLIDQTLLIFDTRCPERDDRAREYQSCMVAVRIQDNKINKYQIV